MNILIFLAGVGVGTFVSGILFIIILTTATKGPTKYAKERDEITEKLLRERNETDAKIESHLSIFKDWLHENWKKG